MPPVAAFACACALVALCVGPSAAQPAGSETLTLAQAVGRARATRLDARAAKLERSAAAAAAHTLALYPAIRLDAGASTRPDPGGGEDLTLYAPLDLFGRQAAGRASARAALSQADAALRQAEMDVQQEVLQAYVEAASADLAAAAAQSQLAEAEELARATRALLAAEAAPAIQLVRVTLEVDRARAQLASAQSEARAARLRLNGAVGSEVGQTLTLEGCPPVPPVADPASARPDLLALAAARDAARSEARMVRAESRPTLEMQARRFPWSAEERDLGARLQLSMPLLDFGAARAQAQAADGRLDAAALRLRHAVRAASLEDAAAAAELGGAVEALADADKLVEACHDIVARTRAGFAQGGATLLDVLDALRALREAEGGRVDAMKARMAATGKLLAARGVLL
ncbi:MAG: TolC family protein [Armatimonadetes bacterium]|nr:TolC family protein [Armatimonadota bacterium]